MIPESRQARLENLAKGYHPGFRVIEISSLVVAFALLARLVWRIAPVAIVHPFVSLFALFLSLPVMDLIAGIVHWAGDTWGTIDTPILGQNFFRSFREHHVDPMAITRHDFVQANGANALVALIILVPLQFVNVSTNVLPFFLLSFTFWIGLFAVFSNKFHAWAHDPKRPWIIRQLQRVFLVLPVAHHAKHHVPPYTIYYCVFIGWMNPITKKIGFFPWLERVVTALTGLQPRIDPTDYAIVMAKESEQL
jgi:ubiquitin-conjugating enzyme E2 variant